MPTTKIAVIQLSCCGDIDSNIDKAASFVKTAAGRGAKIILLPELFASPYFCKTQDSQYFALAESIDESKILQRFRALAKQLSVVLPISFFEKTGDGNHLFNSLATIDADGEIVGLYRKAHIPDGPGYSEKFYFTPGDTPIESVRCAYARLGGAICWDQWFPECARLLALSGGEILLYPTAIGSEPHLPGYSSLAHWQRAICGNAASNIIPVGVSNRIGEEQQQDAYGNSVSVSFYGNSFIADPYGEIIQQMGEDEEGIIDASFDLPQIAEQRRNWGLFRDRRIDLYRPLVTHRSDR